MDWIVFGDDWGSHPSTTQHLVRNLPATDRVIWVDSIGMRSPRLTLADGKRLINKARAILFENKSKNTEANSRSHQTTTLNNFLRIKPKVIPFHLNPVFQKFNSLSLQRNLNKAINQLGMGTPHILSANPVVIQYLNNIPHNKVAYLRLDDYARLPGVDPDLVMRTEKLMYDNADVVFATARDLLPVNSAKGHYLPQGVDIKHFSQASTAPAGTRVLGFFGLIAEWIDFRLIEEVAALAPEWTLEFIGPARYLPDNLKQIKNISLKPAVSFDQLPFAISHWTCAWIPFEISDLTRAVNPLKAREYLAAGLPTHCTPLPEVISLQKTSEVMISTNPVDIVNWMNDCYKRDSTERRQAIRESVSGDGWGCRCESMRQALESA